MHTTGQISALVNLFGGLWLRFFFKAFFQTYLPNPNFIGWRVVGLTVSGFAKCKAFGNKVSRKT